MKFHRTLLWPALACFGVAFCTMLLAPLHAAPGDLDTTFNGTGKVTTTIGSLEDIGQSVAMQADGKIVVAGYFNNGSNNDFALARYNADGTLDTTFNGTGKAITSIGSSDDYGQSVAVQADGKIVVAGYFNNGSNNDFALVRYSADGTLDTTFNGTGKAITPIGSGDDGALSVAVQADDKIVVAGYSFNGSNNVFALVRYSADGTLDTTFNGTGKVTTPIDSIGDIGHSVAVQADGKIVVAGSSRNASSNNDFALVRYSADGTLDTTFNSTGKVTTPISSRQEIGQSVAVQADGKIVVGGYCSINFNNDFALVRYNADGTLDTTFNGTGKVTTPISSGTDVGYSVAVQADGKIVVAGHANGEFAVVRYNANGTLDTTFNGTGKVTTPIGSITDIGYSVAVQADGKIVVAGYSSNGSDYDFALVRYDGVAPIAGPITNPANGHQYYLLSESDWVTSENVAKNLSGHLVTINDAAENQWVFETFSAFGGVSRSLWLGFNDAATEGSFVWASGESVTYTNWAVGSPDNGSGVKSYAHMHKPGAFGGLWNDTVSPNTNAGLDPICGVVEVILAPVVSTDTASGVTMTGATLNGTVNANGATTAVTFEYGLTNSYGSSATATPSSLTGASNTAVSAALSGLQQGTTYHFRVKGASSAGTSYSADAIFTTPSDTSAPVFSGVPGNMTVNAPSNGATAAVNWTEPTASDNVGVTSVTSTHNPGAVFPVGVTTVTYTAKDASGNTGTASFTVTVVDSTKPVISGMPGNLTASTSQGSATAVATWTKPSANDNVGVTSFTSTHSSGAAFPVGVTTVTYTAKDAAGNTDTASFTVTVLDASKPVFSNVPASRTVNTPADSATAVVSWAAPSASDNVGVTSVTSTHSPGAVFPLGTTTVTYTAEDAAGNTGTASFTVTVVDSTKPVISGMPGNLTVSTSQGSATAVATWTKPSANDNVGVTSFTSTHSSGAAFPVGVTTVTYTATDAAGNTGTASFKVTVVDASVPVFSNVPANMTVNTPADSATAVVSWAAPSASDNVGVTSFTSTHSSGAAFPVGVTTVNYTATDAAGNTGTASFTVTVVDSVKPTITAPAGGFIPVMLTTAAGAGGVVSVPDYRSQAEAYDAVGVSGVSQTPAPGAALRAGSHSVTLTVTDTSGNSDALSFTVTVKTGDPVTEQIFTKGAAVPEAGVPGSGIPAGATWNSFGVPAINGAGEMAFIATLTLSPSGTLTGVFAGPADAPALLMKKGDAAPGTDGAVFASFKDPLFNEAGRMAFVATISGTGITGANNSGIWTNVLGADAAVFQLVARKGGSVPGVDRARWKSFSSVALASGELNLFGTVASGAGGVSAANDLVLCRYGAGAPGGELLLREGQQLSIDGVTGKLKSFAALATVSGSPGQRRQPLDGGLHVKATLSDRRTCLFNNIGAAGLSQLEVVTGDALVDQNSQPAGTLASLGFAADASGSAWGSVFKAALKGAGTSAADNSALVGASADGLSILARKGEEADSVRIPGALIKSFASEPVASEAGYAAVVTLSGKGISKARDTALFWRGNAFSGILAREGDPAPGVGGALYGSFVSVALPDGAAGPIFVAKLLSAKPGPAGRVTARNDLGLWATDTSGAVRLLLREGDPLDGKTVTSFVALPVVLGSAAQARSYNDAGTIAVKVTFSDGAEAIVWLRVP